MFLAKFRHVHKTKIHDGSRALANQNGVTLDRLNDGPRTAAAAPRSE